MRKVIDILFYAIALIVVVVVVRNIILNVQWMNRHCHTHTRDGG